MAARAPVPPAGRRRGRPGPTGILWAAVALVALAGCVDFGLGSRRYHCQDDPTVCGPGWVCGADGFCLQPAAGDASVEVCNNGLDDDNNSLVDCRDPACGAASCDDSNPCTSDLCPVTGICTNEPHLADSSCGPGCTCRAGGIATEVACADTLDNDGDNLVDCADPDCPACAGGLTCCSDGACRTTCP